MAQGQAAGTAAALASKGKSKPVEIEGETLRDLLIKDGAILNVDS
jgi:hypothetical protein